MAERDSWATMNGATRVVDAEDSRVAFGALLQPGATATAKSVGIINAAGTPGLVAATAPTPDVNVKVSAFQAAIPATRGMGPYIATLDADKTLNVLGTDPADPSNARRDLIIARQTDTYYADGSTAYTVMRVKGTAAGSPVDPDPTQGGLYPDYLLLARIRIGAGATTITGAIIDDLRPARVVALGGVVPVANVTERAALPAVPGLTIYRRDKGWTEVYNGTTGTWQCQGTVTTGSLADITHPFAGQLAILTTDNVLYRWTGSAWNATISLVNAAAPRGVIAYGTFTGAGSITTANLIQSETATGTVVNGRRYKVTHVRSEAGASNILNVQYRYKAGGTIDLAGSTQLQLHTDAPPGSFRTVTRESYWIATFTGQVTFGVSSFVNSGTGSVDSVRVRELLIEDIGI
ncbi:hypothetical protein P3102_35265 [Amycolatopsis sp. QT-25]|uniref:hypothetical protein n=1 Tax=Amycolatopsis sp. QT-25 TaxID=3034022 RepID=UPI0023ECB50D|nr:hypothetical protein [Amycolatopsis sp. QT-25]WET79230.1 hypothetical protein P3102_35265 [Amycolatopsis sp. QT-25]